MIDQNDPRLTSYERDIAAMRGDFRHKSDQEALACCALGLAEECAEVAFAVDGRGEDPIAELGDVVWYVTTAANRLDWTMERLVNDIETNVEMSDYDEDEDCVREMAMHAGVFAGHIKKWLFHDKPLSKARTIRALAEVLECAHRAARQLGSTLNAARDLNVAKLRKRYPSGGFTTAEANARADERPTE
jgi:NTP pyrophosphatase (non-canonical NTP hydrolase)